MEQRISVYFCQYGVEPRRDAPTPAVIRNFKQADGADSRRFISLKGDVQSTSLFAGQFCWLNQTANDDVGVEQQSGRQGLSPRSGLTSASHSSDGPTRSPAIRPCPAKAPMGDRSFGLRAGPSVATGMPRFVIVMLEDSSETSSNRARHFALNSVALTTTFFIRKVYHVSGHLTSSP